MSGELVVTAKPQLLPTHDSLLSTQYLASGGPIRSYLLCPDLYSGSLYILNWR